MIHLIEIENFKGIKGIQGMSWLSRPKKVVADCEKPGVIVSRC